VDSGDDQGSTVALGDGRGLSMVAGGDDQISAVALGDGRGRRNGRDREDLMAEIGGRVRSGISMLQSNLVVAEISKIASSLLPFCQEEADKGEPIVGVTKEVPVFVRHISTRPKMWLDFPLFISER
jgi:hypothetical protein